MPRRFHGITKEVAKFGIIGIVNVVVNVAVVNLLLLTVFRGSEVKANIIAVIVAATSAYFMNRHWTYRDRPRSSLRREYTLFFIFNLVGLIIQAGVVAFTKYALHDTHIIAVNISTMIGIGLGTVFRFWAYRTHVFKLTYDEPEPSPSVALAAALADTPDPPAEDDQPEPELEAAPGARLVVTSSAGGSIVIKVLAADDAGEELDEIDLDDRVRATP